LKQRACVRWSIAVFEVGHVTGKTMLVAVTMVNQLNKHEFLTVVYGTGVPHSMPSQRHCAPHILWGGRTRPRAQAVQGPLYML
jgi:hypothetical protein